MIEATHYSFTFFKMPYFSKYLKGDIPVGIGEN